MSIKRSVSPDPPAELPCDIFNLVDLLRLRALEHPEKLAYTYLVDGDADEINFTYADLDRRARAIGARLQAMRMAGERALLIYPPGLDYIAAFFGCLYSGVIAVPTYPPAPGQLNDSTARFQSIAKDAKPLLAMTTAAFLKTIQDPLSQAIESQAMSWLTTDDLIDDPSDRWQYPLIDGQSLAFLQYTSGSTATPKGVMISHDNLLHNERMIRSGCEHTEDSTFVGWLPLYHDMGLIGNVLQPLYIGARCILMSPGAFLQKPFRWLSAISRYRGATSGGPNFSYELCLRNITAEQRQSLDLSCWSVAFNGAEPIRQDTIERFVTMFEPCGFRREAFYPCYGLAEATLIVTGSRRALAPLTGRFQAQALEDHRVIEPAAESQGARSLVGSGGPMPGQKVLIVNPDTLTKCASAGVGEVWVSGPNIAQGYWQRSQETEQTFRARLADEGDVFLRTGDLGFIYEGELFITGRLKDLIIIRGRNHYPQDIELTIERCHPALRQGCGAAFSVDINDEERLVVVQELARHHTDLNLNELAAAIREAVVIHHELQAYAVVLIKAGSIPKTSSGKIQRHACKAKFLADSLDVAEASILDERFCASSNGHMTRESLLTLDLYERYARLEEYLKHHLSRILRVDPYHLDARQSLTALGVDSLAGIELRNRIEIDLQMILPLATILQSSSISQITRQLLDQGMTPSSIKPVSAAARHSGDGEPLSYGQQSLWFIHQLAPESTAYNLSLSVRIRGELDVLVLRRTFQALIERHAALRTTFPMVNGKPIQRVDEHTEVSFHLIDASDWSDELLGEHLVKGANCVFNPATGPLLMINLFARSAQEHVLQIVVHHIVADFWSLALFIDEMGSIYRAEKDGGPLALKPLELQYTDYAHWQSQMLSSPEGERLWAFWQDQLSGDLPVLNLPTDYPRPLVQGYRGASRAFRVRPERTREIKRLSQIQDVTLFMTLLAAFQVLLHRYTSQEDILVGSSTSGRSRAELSGLVGYFVNPVVLRADFTGAPTFEEFLHRVRETVLAAFEHQDYPFSLLVERLRPVRDPARSAIFQVLFVLQKAPLLSDEGLTPFALGEGEGRIELGGLVLESVPLKEQPAQFDLTLMIAEVDGGLSGSLKYNTALFEGSTIERMLGHFETLLESLVANPRQPVSHLQMLTPAERHRLLVDYNHTAEPYPQGVWLPELFQNQAHSTPESIAITCEGSHLTYLELNRRANRLAHYLTGRAVAAEGLVGVCMYRSVEMVVGLMGVLKSGAAYLPLDPDYPQQRLARILDEAQVSLILTQQSLKERLAAIGAEAISLDEEWAAIAIHSEADPCVKLDGRHLAYVIYTSGSTGVPKGVMNTHGGIHNRLLWMQDAYGLTADDAVLQKTPFAFDVSVWEFFWPLMVGARLVVAQPGGHKDGAYLRDLIIRQNVTTLHFVPSMLRVFLNESGLTDCRCIRRVICSGEALPYDLQERFFSSMESAELHNLYGPTEAAIDVTYWPCQSEPDRQVVPIGRPIANTQLFLLDEGLELVPEALIGELYIAGAGVARGYLKQPDKTAERFMPNPYSSEAGGRMYRSGDLCRYGRDGNIEYEGRTDEQVKIRGYRIELGEVAVVLSSHESVEECVVVARGGGGEQVLVGYVVMKEGAGDRERELKEYLWEKLPEYMVPAVIMRLSEMPLMGNGKIDKGKLPEARREGREADESYEGARNEVEAEVVRIWEEVLGTEGVGIHDNFFQLGGHSLLIIQVASRVQQSFGVNIDVRTFFQGPTVASLATAITQLRTAKQEPQEIAGLLDMLDQLSEDEVRALLQGESTTTDEAVYPPIDSDLEMARQSLPNLDPTPATVSVERYRCADIDVFAVGDDMGLVYSRDSHTSQVLNAELIGLLQSCRAFKTLEDQALACCEDPSDQVAVDSIKSQLATLVDYGFLTSYRHALEKITAPVDETTEAVDADLTIASVACPTSNRMDALQRCLSSYIENARAHNRTNDYVVMDDSPGLETRAASRQMLYALKQKYGVGISYAGLEEKLLYAKKLIDTKELPPEVVKFALFDIDKLGLITTGANRNAISLHTVGDPILIVDDDTVCKIASAPEKQEGLALVSATAPTEEHWVFPDREAALRFADYTELDLLALHEQLLGRRLRSYVTTRKAKGGVNIDHADARFLRELEAGHGRVMVTMNGVVGDCRWGFPFYMFFQGHSLDRLIQSESDYRTGCATREILQVANRLTVTDQPDSMMGTFFGLDNRQLVPPFLPSGRGQDHILGVTLRSCFNHSYFAYLPYALLHLPVETRHSWAREILRKPSGISLATLFEALIVSFEFGSSGLDGKERMRRLGSYLEEVGSMSGADFQQHVGIEVRRKVSSVISELEDRLQRRSHQPAYWADDVKQFIRVLRESLVGEDFIVPLDLRYGRGMDEARHLTRSLVLKFGQLLYWWPDIVSVASTLRDKGHRVAQPV